ISCSRNGRAPACAKSASVAGPRQSCVARKRPAPRIADYGILYRRAGELEGTEPAEITAVRRSSSSLLNQNPSVAPGVILLVRNCKPVLLRLEVAQERLRRPLGATIEWTSRGGDTDKRVQFCSGDADHELAVSNG